ncbi:bowman-birk serine protease inhibitor family protein (macronuclear) [Tetrahymena thermophila SB210]|uniref:Bowman-birk serine protease inhibitor family protein n=1 Tax=Tetrahymena thermophila (strain SB210) TaxID=312017 RepID=Q22UM5_TETTS|nr:bowman-birk serine protease inhibitor family protein [Tetrahymena thermophila SB210]EAR88945.2 bowman-birk serine protease inhibitor family protein [Tetrahymena thermophila SB210]|eukprot:XP_001009190.2 bowman-birk serine protease inhibitor family protein [Tetrahymena thermophila SB210]
MWVLFKFQDFPATDYNFLTIKQGSTDLLIVKINPSIYFLQLIVLGNIQRAVASNIIENKWLLVTITLITDGNYINGSIAFKNYETPAQTTSISSTGPYNSLLQQQSIQLQIGNFAYMQKKGCLQSLGFIDNLNIYWGSDTDTVNMNNGASYSDDYTAQTTELIWDYDFFYTKANPNKYFNIAQSMHKYINGFQSTSNTLILNGGQTFKTDYINSLQNKGIIISFHFKISSVPPASQNLILMSISNSDISIYIDSFGSLRLLGESVNGQIGSDWYQIVLIIKNAQLNDIYLFLSRTQKIKTYYQKLSIGQLQFGDPSNKITIEFNHIRYYKGAQVFLDQGYCFLSNQDLKTCLMCQDSYPINYKDNLSCSNIPGALKFIDWNKDSPDCPYDMIYDSSANCVCMKQFFKTTDNRCSKCPDYCDECTDKNTCVKQDPMRKVDGRCPDQYFDDGYSCILISQKLTIQKKINLISYFDQVQFLSFNNVQMQLPSTGPYSFFFCFNFSFDASTPSKKFAVISDSTNEIFSFYYQASSSPSISFPSIKVSYLSTTFTEAFINFKEPVWISFWTDMTQVFLLIQSYSQFFSDLQVLSSNIKLTDPFICIGLCNADFISSPSLKSLVFIQAMNNPSNDENTLQQFLSPQVQKIAIFEILADSDLSQVYNNKIVKNKNLKLQYVNIPQIDELNGFMFTQISYATVLNIDLKYWISFYCTILPVKINQQVSLLSYEVDQTIEYFLVPQGEKIQIRICYSQQCIDTKYSMLNLNQSNNLLILMRNKTPFSAKILFIEFEVVCNYKREQIQFLNPLQTINKDKLNLFIGLQKNVTSDYLFYLNMINIDQGDGFYYFDYTKLEDCFIFINIVQMQCIIYKNNLLMLQNNLQTILINEKQCLEQIVQQGYQMFANYQARQCQLRCADGYYKDPISKRCFKCFPQCKTCSGSRSNCTSCNYSDQQLPLCNCIYSNFFLNEQNQCQKCSEKCRSCTQNENLCLQCSADRVNPPKCECDPFQFLEINNQCIKIESCEKDCRKCKFDSSNNKTLCYQCKDGRTNPPQCDCLPNYRSNQDGTCSPCPSSQYFDKNIQDCQPCSLPCQTCQISASYCTSCSQNLQLKNNQCSCSNGLEVYQMKQNSQENACKQHMNVNLSVQLKDSAYYVIFKFDHDLKQIDFKNLQFENLIQLILSEVSQSLYSFNNPEIDGNNLIVKIDIYQSIKATIGMALFKQTNLFVSDDEKYVLSSNYLKQPIQFQVGPYIFQEAVFNKDLQQLVNEIKNSNNQDLLKLIQQMNFVFYLLNTVQPSNLFMLLKLHFPPNLFMFYQIIGSFIYPGIVDYMSSNYKQNFYLFGYGLNQTEVHLIDNSMFQRIGFSNSFIVNAPVIILKYLILLFIMILILISKQFLSFKSANTLDKLNKINQILKQRINAENEVNLLMVLLCILTQFTTFEQDIWSVRYGYYAATYQTKRI